jgi:hypothetical protein
MTSTLRDGRVPMHGPRRVTEPELVGAAEAARLLGVRQSNLRTLAGLPEPYQRLRSGTLWRATDIKALAWSRLARQTATSTPTTNQEAA